MFVKNLMVPKRELVLVAPTDTIKKALDLIGQNKFLSIPVVGDNKFYGIISKEKIYTFFFEKGLEKDSLMTDFMVKDMLDTDVPTINSLEQIETAAHFLEMKNIAFVAVEDENGVFKGIITHHTIFHIFTELFGLDRGKRLSVIAYDIPGQISKLSRIISENNGDIISFVIADPEVITEVKEIIIRIRTENFENIQDKVREAGFKIQD